MPGAHTLGVALQGLEGTVVTVEADVAPGLPAFALVGMPDSSMLQARDRVRAACAHVGTPLASRRITVNLVPAWLPKHGTGFDLAIALAVLAAQGRIAPHRAASSLHLGELGLDGSIRAVPGVLPALRAAREAGIDSAVVPAANAGEASLVEGLRIHPAHSLTDVLRFHGADIPEQSGPRRTLPDLREPSPPPPAGDFADVIGQETAKHAAAVAAAGGHHLMLTGPPGTGKTMIASRLPSILPPLTDEDALAVSAIRSLEGRFDAREGLVRRAPFEAPHHTASAPAIVGGGSGVARPGAITRAHAGVLFLDEAPEFSPAVLDSLREPLESGEILVQRSRGVTRFPARFQLVLAANPCPCGKAWGRGKDCVCTAIQRRRYLTRLSGPVMDRIDLRVTVPPPPPGTLTAAAAHGCSGQSSGDIAALVRDARERAAHRFAAEPFSLNARIPAPLLRTRYRVEDARILDASVRAGTLTLRGRDRVLRIAWTLADLDGSGHPTGEHIGTALTLRQEDRS